MKEKKKKKCGGRRWLLFFRGTFVFMSCVCVSVPLMVSRSWLVLAPSSSGSNDSGTKQESSALLPIPFPSKLTTHNAEKVKPLVNVTRKFYLIPLPEMTSWLVGNYTDEAVRFYQDTLNEEQAEIWLHRGLENMTQEQGRAVEPSEADVFIITGYLHLAAMLRKKKVGGNARIARAQVLTNQQWIQIVLDRLVDPDKPHLVAIPTWNPSVSRRIGIAALVKALKGRGLTKLFSFGFERNTFWQHLPVSRIIPIPYVVKVSKTLTRQELHKQLDYPPRRRKENFVFYVGSVRKHAFGWSGCNRSVVLPLVNRTDMFVRLVDDKKQQRRNNDSSGSSSPAIPQEQYNRRLAESDYCLLLCGDTPTSRSLASAMLHGCIPIRVGSRLRGLCEQPSCRPGWGWNVVAGDDHESHLPFADKIDWSLFPEVREDAFAERPARVLHDVMKRFDNNDSEKKAAIRKVMEQHQMGWLYGWGNPVYAQEFGDAVSYAWEEFTSSFALVLQRERESK